jgi:hypothetical protein
MAGVALAESQSFRVLLALLLAACAISTSQGSANDTVPVAREVSSIVSAECYSLSYSDAVGSASARLFPAWLMLRPGADSGSAAGRPVDDGLLKYSGWKRITADSLEVMFTGNFEGIRIHVARAGANLSGRATWLTDLIGLPEASMLVIGNRKQCAQNVSPAT